jgi:hypothetical protein
MFQTRTTVLGKKRFGGATWKEVLLSPLPGKNARLDEDL